MEALQVLTRLDAEFLSEQASAVGVDGQGSFLSPGQVEAANQLPPQTLTERMENHQRLDQLDRLAGSSEIQHDGDVLLDRQEAAILESTGYLGGERLVAQVG